MAAEELPSTAQTKESPGQMELALAREFLEVNRKEIELRGQQLALQKDAQSQGHEYALAALSAQGRDRAEERQHRRSASKQYLIFSGIISLALLVLAGFALKWDKEAVVLETLKDIGLLGGGAGAGALWGYRKAQRETMGLSDSSNKENDPI